ncbi:hypothetical protein ACRRTK_005873 [Alexandromys fortis]
METGSLSNKRQFLSDLSPNTNCVSTSSPNHSAVPIAGDGLQVVVAEEDSSTTTTPRRRHATSEGPDRQPRRHEEEEEGAGGAAGPGTATSAPACPGTAKRVPPQGEKRSALPPVPPRPSSACGHGSRRKPLFLSALRLGGSVRGASPQSPRPEPDQGDSRLPIPSPHSPGRPPASATRPDPSGIPPSWAATLSTSAIAPDPKPRPRGPGPRGGFRTAPDVRLPPPTCLSFLKPSPAPAVHRPKGPGASPPGWRPSPRARLHAPTHIRNLAGPQST